MNKRVYVIRKFRPSAGKNMSRLMYDVVVKAGPDSYWLSLVSLDTHEQAEEYAKDPNRDYPKPNAPFAPGWTKLLAAKDAKFKHLIEELDLKYELEDQLRQNALF